MAISTNEPEETVDEISLHKTPEDLQDHDSFHLPTEDNLSYSNEYSKEPNFLHETFTEPVEQDSDNVEQDAQEKTVPVRAIRSQSSNNGMPEERKVAYLKSSTDMEDDLSENKDGCIKVPKNEIVPKDTKDHQNSHVMIGNNNVKYSVPNVSTNMDRRKKTHSDSYLTMQSRDGQSNVKVEIPEHFDDGQDKHAVYFMNNTSTKDTNNSAFSEMPNNSKSLEIQASITSFDKPQPQRRKLPVTSELVTDGTSMDHVENRSAKETNFTPNAEQSTHSSFKSDGSNSFLVPASNIEDTFKTQEQQAVSKDAGMVEIQKDTAQEDEPLLLNCGQNVSQKSNQLATTKTQFDSQDNVQHGNSMASPGSACSQMRDQPTKYVSACYVQLKAQSPESANPNCAIFEHSFLDQISIPSRENVHARRGNSPPEDVRIQVDDPSHDQSHDRSHDPTHDREDSKTRVDTNNFPESSYVELNIEGRDNDATDDDGQNETKGQTTRPGACGSCKDKTKWIITWIALIGLFGTIIALIAISSSQPSETTVTQPPTITQPTTVEYQITENPEEQVAELISFSSGKRCVVIVGGHGEFDGICHGIYKVHECLYPKCPEYFPSGGKFYCDPENDVPEENQFDVCPQAKDLYDKTKLIS